MALASAARALDVRSSIGHDRGDRGTRHDRGLRGRGPVAHGRIVVFLLVSVGLLIAWIVGSVAANVIVDLPIGVAALLGGVHLLPGAQRSACPSAPSSPRWHPGASWRPPRSPSTPSPRRCGHGRRRDRAHHVRDHHRCRNHLRVRLAGHGKGTQVGQGTPKGVAFVRTWLDLPRPQRHPPIAPEVAAAMWSCSPPAALRPAIWRSGAPRPASHRVRAPPVGRCAAESEDADNHEAGGAR